MEFRQISRSLQRTSGRCKCSLMSSTGTVFPEIGITPYTLSLTPNPKCQDTLYLIWQEIKIAIFRYFTNTLTYTDKLRTICLCVYGKYEYCRDLLAQCKRFKQLPQCWILRIWQLAIFSVHAAYLSGNPSALPTIVEPYNPTTWLHGPIYRIRLKEDQWSCWSPYSACHTPTPLTLCVVAASCFQLT